MKLWPDSRSPWRMQLRFEESEFEEMMDVLRSKTGGDAFVAGRGIDVDLVLLKGLGVEADYVSLPPNVLGRTTFHPDGQVIIEVSRELSEDAVQDPVARRRLRTTLAHECGHVACHARFFIRDTETLSLFGEYSGALEPPKPPIMCRSEGVGGKYNGEWWEYQANRCMAALLMPKNLIHTSMKVTLRAMGFASGNECIATGQGERLIRVVSDEYDVSQVAVLYRLQDLGFISNGLQGEMNLGLY